MLKGLTYWVGLDVGPPRFRTGPRGKLTELPGVLPDGEEVCRPPKNPSPFQPWPKTADFHLANPKYTTAQIPNPGLQDLPRP